MEIGTCEAARTPSFMVNLRGGLFGRALRAKIGISARFDLFLGGWGEAEEPEIALAVLLSAG
jgi:hypothetical protein